MSHRLGGFMLLVSLLLATVSEGSAWAAAAEEAFFVGTVTVCHGSPSVVRSGQVLPVVRGTRIARGDVVRTPGGASAGIVFADDTILSLGPATEIAVDEYLFDPAARQLSFVARVVRGTVAYLTGQIAKLAPSAAKIVAPTAAIATRGTYVLIRVP